MRGWWQRWRKYHQESREQDKRIAQQVYATWLLGGPLPKPRLAKWVEKQLGHKAFPPHGQ